VSSFNGMKFFELYRKKYKSFSVREVNDCNFDLAIDVLHIQINMLNNSKSLVERITLRGYLCDSVVHR